MTCQLLEEVTAEGPIVMSLGRVVVPSVVFYSVVLFVRASLVSGHFAQGKESCRSSSMVGYERLEEEDVVVLGDGEIC
jgi:hypothetical protein